MWEQLRRTDVELARQKLAELRAITLRRHEEELKELDANEAEIDLLARLAAAIPEKYLTIGTLSEEQARPEDSVQSEGAEFAKPPSPSPLEVQQHVSPNFDAPLRRLVR
jgi:hypothetical protein